MPGPGFYRTARRSTPGFVVAILLGVAAPAESYIGPGAGFALLSSFLVLFTTVLVVIATLLIWPFRTLWRAITRGTPPRPLIKRLIVVGLDGQDPVLTDRFVAEGLLPNFEKLASAGCYRRLRTTFPSVSPVAWSSFSTGTHPARHNIFDFLDRDRRTYLPLLSSTRIGRVERFLRLGRFRIPLHKPELRLLRKSKPFWTILGEHHIWSTVLRVPITFPPDRFYGAELSAMCVPDLKAPRSVSAAGGRFFLDDETETPDTLEVVMDYPDLLFLFSLRPTPLPGFEHMGSIGCLFEGTEASLVTNYEEHEVWIEGKKAIFFPRPDPTIPDSPGHLREFLDAIKSRNLETTCNVRYGHRVTTPGLLANIAYRTDRRIHWNDEKEDIIGDSEARGYLSRQLRKPYTL